MSWGSRAAVALIAAVASVAGLAAPLALAAPAENGKLAWSRGPSFDIWSMNPDGSSQAPLFAGAGDDRNPAFSPDGTKLALARPVTGWGFEIVVVNADGTGALQQVSPHAAQDFEPSWSPDGTRIAFRSDRAGNQDIWVANADGSGQATRLTTDLFADVDPAWSPDGGTIAFHSGRSGSDGSDVYLMDADGGNQRNVTRDLFAGIGSDREPTWSPDGQLVWVGAHPLPQDVYAWDPAGGTVRNVTADAFQFSLRDPVVAPDGTVIAISAPLLSGGAEELYLVPMAGGAATRLTTSSAPDIWPTWQPLPADTDDDGIRNSEDNCPGAANPGQEDADGDGQGDACDADRDGDTVDNGADNCPDTLNADQADADADGQGDACDADRDGDAVANPGDNCPDSANPDQADADADGMGDACDADRDGDDVPDETDNCPGADNRDQADTDGDGTGDVCDADRDGDAVANDSDNCPDAANADQADADGDGQGDLCDPDKPVAEQLAELIAKVQALALPQRTERSLTIKLRLTLAAHNLGRPRIACLLLTSFTLEVRAQSGRAIPASAAEDLIGDATRIGAAMGC